LDRLGILLPFYSNHSEIRASLEKRGKFERIKLLSHIYPYNSKLNILFYQCFGNTRVENGGFTPINGPFKINFDALENDLKNKQTIDALKLQAFTEFINLCQKENINLILTLSPYIDTALVNSNLFTFADSIAKCNNIPLLNFSENKVFYKNNNLFIDHAHLNSKGASIFSNLFADTLMSYIRTDRFDFSDYSKPSVNSLK